MSAKTIDTVVEDIYAVFNEDVTVDPEVANRFGEELSRIVVEQVTERRTPHLRLSNLGNSCRRQLWYSINVPELAEAMHGSTRIKFLIGHITEAVVWFLARLSGHAVTHEQAEVEVNGVKGHIDGLLDGELTDVKSASPYSFTKFVNGITPDTDAFGYLSQLGTYAKGLEKQRGHFLAVDKVLGKLHLDTHDLPDKDYEQDVTDVRTMLASNQPPARGFEDEVEGKSGNRKLGTKCSYCPFKKHCWPGVQTFQYARGPVFLTKVSRQPKVNSVES